MKMKDVKRHKDEKIFWGVYLPCGHLEGGGVLMDYYRRDAVIKWHETQKCWECKEREYAEQKEEK